MQPAFDALWGGDRGLYTDRLGAQRSLASNPFARLAAAGMPLAFGSDAPVTPLAPWEGVRAAVHHHAPGSRVDAATAFAAHTAGGWAAAHRPGGTLTPGAPAHLAVWDTAAFPDLTGAAAPVPAHGREWTDDLGGVMSGELDRRPAGGWPARRGRAGGRAERRGPARQDASAASGPSLAGLSPRRPAELVGSAPARAPAPRGARPGGAGPVRGGR